MKEDVAGRFPCGVSWGISVGHPRVHVCTTLITILYEGPRLIPVPHAGDHVCRCGDLRAVGKAPGGM